jgi:hypothetical protein
MSERRVVRRAVTHHDRVRVHVLVVDRLLRSRCGLLELTVVHLVHR